MLVWVIVACEVGFWVVLAAGLAARYLLRRPRLGGVLLAGVPLVDLVLLVATTVDLTAGARAEFPHGLAAAYLGFSVVFGPSMVRWADQRFAHRFAGGPPPVRPPEYGPERIRHEWREFGKAALAWALSCALLGVMVLVIGDADRSAELVAWIGRLTTVLLIWAIWPVSMLIWPPKPKQA